MSRSDEFQAILKDLTRLCLDEARRKGGGLAFVQVTPQGVTATALSRTEVEAGGFVPQIKERVAALADAQVLLIQPDGSAAVFEGASVALADDAAKALSDGLPKRFEALQAPPAEYAPVARVLGEMAAGRGDLHALVDALETMLRDAPPDRIGSDAVAKTLTLTAAMLAATTLPDHPLLAKLFRESAAMGLAKLVPGETH